MDEIISHNPRTGEEIGRLPVANADEVRAAVGRARKAFEEWRDLSFPDRAEHLKRLKKELIGNSDHYADVIVRETGKHHSDALLADVAQVAGTLDYAIRKGGKLLAPRKASSWPMPMLRTYVEYHPIGVVGVISPWNYPLGLPFIPTVLALAAGCTVVVKPSDVTPLTGELIREATDAAGLPPGVVQVVQGGAATGQALIDAVDLVSFTGSPATARKVASRAAETLTPVLLELGGKDAMVVLEDADLDRAARGAVWGGMFNAGQTCISIERVYVVDAVYDEFLAKVDAQMDGLSAGGPDKGDIGPIIFDRQLEIIESHLEDAVGKGATVVRGGSRVAGPGSFYEPTLLTDVDHTMEIMREETFGPILPIMRVPGEEAALELANDSKFGLHGSVWTKDLARGRSFASRLNTGTVAVNNCLVNFGVPDLPFGGIRESGYGSSNGPEGIRAFTYPKAVAVNRIALKREPWWFPRIGGKRLGKVFLRLAGRG